MLREVIAFANFEFNLRTVMSKVLAGERIQVEERRLINWQEYQNFLENMGLDGNWEDRNFWRRYRLPQADSSIFDELRCFQAEISELLEAIAERRVIPGRYWQKIFRECDGLPMFIRPSETSLADHYGPAELKVLDFHYSFQAETYQAFIMALLRQLIIGGRIFAIVKDENGLFAAREGGVETARDSGAGLGLPDASSPDQRPAETLAAAEAGDLAEPGRAGEDAPASLKSETIPAEGSLTAAMVADDQGEEGEQLEISALDPAPGPNPAPAAPVQAEVGPAEMGLTAEVSFSGFGEAPGGPEPALNQNNSRAAEPWPGVFLNSSVANDGPAMEAEPVSDAAIKARNQGADDPRPRPLNATAAESGPKAPNWFKIPIEYIVDNLDRLKSGRNSWPAPCGRAAATENKD